MVTAGTAVAHCIHPSLQRKAILNMEYGLFEVVPEAVYQVRGFDLANISFVKGDTGWIIFDPLTSRETAAAALALVTEHLGHRPVVAVVYSHSHVDHFGGVRGVVDEADVKSGRVQVIAPPGFMEHAVATLIPVSPSDSAPLYVELMGGAAPILAKAGELVEAGRYLLAVEVLNKLVHAEPGNTEARALLADAFEQVGYQAESPSVRNSFLAAALELRSGIPTGAIPKTGGADVVRAISTGQFLDFLGIRLDSAAAEGTEFTVNLLTPDTGETFAVELSNATLTNLPGFLVDYPDLTLTVDRAALEEAMIGATTLQQLVSDGTARLEGDPGVLARLASLLVHFEVGFEIMPGTGATGTSTPMADFEQEPVGDTAGG